MVEEMLEPTLSETELETLGRELKQFKKDCQFLDSHRTEWTVAHPDRWVVVFNEKLVSVGITPKDALQKARQQGIDLPRVAIEYLSSKPVKMILPGENT